MITWTMRTRGLLTAVLVALWALLFMAAAVVTGAGLAMLAAALVT